MDPQTSTADGNTTTTDSGQQQPQPQPTTQQPKHTEFLDLTNGQGGEAGSSSVNTFPSTAASATAGLDSIYAAVTAAAKATTSASSVAADSSGLPTLANTGGDVTSTNGSYQTATVGLKAEPPSRPEQVSFLPSTAATPGKSSDGGPPSAPFNSPPPSSSSPPYFDPNTPGRIVETGQEHTGRWTKEEHEAFLSGLQMYGKEWKKVAAKVKTRTVVQTRTHAQKYFQKLAKSEGKDGEFAEFDLSTANEPKWASEKKKKRRATPSTVAAPTTASTTAPIALAPKPAAPSLTPLPPPAQQFQRTASVASAAKVISNLSSQLGAPNPPPLSSTTPVPAHGFQTHGFTSGSVGLPTPAVGSGATHGSSIGASSFPMKIIAPRPDSTMKMGKFPEPSPAACGKRKLAEIAAARMLAGVASSGLKAPRTDEDSMTAEATATATATAPTTTPSAAAVSGLFTSPPSARRNLSETMNTADNIEDGTATPPPEEVQSSVGTNSVPAIPAAASTGTYGTTQQMPVSAQPFAQPKKPGFGLSLQIVNPESLGVSNAEIEKKRKAGGSSPVTPFDSDLQALVSEEKLKGPPSVTKQDNSALSIPQAPDLGAFTDGTPQPTKGFPHPICGPGSAYGRSKLHKAVCDMDLASVQKQLVHQSSGYTERRDQKGFCPIHSACALCMLNPINSSMATEIVRMLINAGADASMRDYDGNTPLHWAARAGDKGTAEFLLVKNNPKDAKNERGETPLHWALRAGRVGIPVAATLLENGARPSVWSSSYKRPIDVAADGYDDEEDSVQSIRTLVDQRRKISKDQRSKLREAAEERKEARANLFECSPQSRSLVLYHPECLQHIPKAESDWENPTRVSSIMERLQATEVKPGSPRVHPWEIQISQEFDRAKLDLLRKVHSTEYLNFVNELSKDLERQHKEQNGQDEEEKTSGAPPVVPFTPMVQRTMIKVEESSVKLGHNSDTAFSAGSLRAARRAAGAVQHAVDCVLIGRQRNAFCVVRPPGHHAGINGLLEGGESCGFCIFNSVAAGAMHAISDERLLCERCAIVDIDVHHGNGTEEIVRKCHDPRKLFFFSIHLYDNEHKRKRETKAFQYKFYPGTGDEDDLPLNIINVPISPLWKVKDQQAAAVTGNHNTRHRTRNRAANLSDDGDSSETGTPKASDVETETTRTSSGSTSPLPPGRGSGRMAYRKAIQDRLLPALRAFNPDLILISAGFDACKQDVGNAKHEFGGKTKMGLDLEPEDYAWTTRKILEIADICCQGRVVSVLEGGYGRPPPNTAGGAYDPSTPLDKSLFSECAIRHIHGMIDPYNAEARFSGGSSRKSE